MKAFNIDITDEKKTEYLELGIGIGGDTDVFYVYVSLICDYCD